MTGSAESGRRVPPLHLITDDEVLAREVFAAQAAKAIRAGGPAVALHLRGPRTSGRRLFDLATLLAAEAREAGALLLVNDRVDVAMASSADGVQLGARSMIVAEARRLLGPDRLVGRSVHSADEAAEAAGQGADFVLAGTLFPSASHPERAGSGVGWLAALDGLGVAVVGIGGITPGRVAEVRSAGAAGVAVVRSVWNAADIGEAVRTLVMEVTS